MQLEHRFEVAAPVDVVWALMLDLERVTPCLPGAAVEARVDDRTYDVGIGVKLGPVQLNYRGRLEIVEIDESEHRAVMRAHATEKRGQGTAEATIATVLVAVDGGTQATTRTDLRLTGRVAQMGRGIVEDVSNRLLGQFAECLGEKAGRPTDPAVGAEPETSARPIGGFSLALGVVLDRLRRLLRRRGP